MSKRTHQGLREGAIEGQVTAPVFSNGAARDAHIVAVTGYGQDEDMRKSRDAGIDEHLLKPVDPDSLFECVARGRDSSPSALGDD